MAILWQADLDRGREALSGNHGKSGFSRLEAPDPTRQARIIPVNGIATLRCECKYGDQFYDPNTQAYFTEQRCLLDIGQLQLKEGDECVVAARFGVGNDQLPPAWRGWEPKNDELARYVQTGGREGRTDGGMFFEWHHAPANGNWSDPALPGSAPMAFHGTGESFRLQIIDPAVGGPRNIWDLAPINRGGMQGVAIRTLWSEDPAKGFIEVYDLDTGKPLLPHFTTYTLYPSPPFARTIVYPVFGLYRRLNIGNPSRQYAWPVDPPAGTTYPFGFSPRKGARVYPQDDGYPQYVLIQSMVIGERLEDVMATANPTSSTPITPTQATPSTPPAAASPTSGAAPAPQWLWKDVRGSLDAQVKAANDQVDALQGQLDKAKALRDGLTSARDTLAKKLDSGPSWLAP